MSKLLQINLSNIQLRVLRMFAAQKLPPVDILHSTIVLVTNESIIVVSSKEPVITL